MAATGGNGGRWAVLLGLAFIGALGLAVLILWPGLQPADRSPSGAPLPLPPGPTARQAEQAVREAARDWQPDASLSSLSAHWQWARGKWSAQTIWTVHFYSPSSGRLAVFLVEVGRVRMLREAISPYPMPTFAEDRWKVDSLQALEGWWAGGGADFLARQPNAEVTLQLKPASPADNRPVWVVTAVAGRQVQTVTLSGVDGKPMP